jgi:hypothetical protein
VTTSVCGACGKVIFRSGPGRPRKLCPECRTERYGREHKARREFEMQNYIGKPCSRCGRPMEAGDEVHLDHVDGGGPNDYRGLSHKRCNLAAAAAVRDRRTPARVEPVPPRRRQPVPCKFHNPPRPDCPHSRDWLWTGKAWLWTG